MNGLPKHWALFSVRLCINLAPKKDHFNKNADALFLKDRPFCLLGWNINKVMVNRSSLIKT